MRILMINVVCGIRSTGRICTDLASALEAHGHEVKIAYGRGNVPGQFQKYAIRIGSDLSVKLHGLKARLFDGCGFGSRVATEEFIKWVKVFDPDVIHLHNIHGYYINIEILFSYLRMSRKRIIWTLHDCWAFTGHAAFCEGANCERWISGCYDCPKKGEYPRSIIDFSKANWEKKKKIFGGIDNLTIITPSEWLASLVRESFLSEYPILNIYNGIDTTVFKPVDTSTLRQKLNIGNKKVILGVAAVWDERKGLADFIKLQKKLEKIDKEFQIILIGLSHKQIELLPVGIIGFQRTDSVQQLVELYSLASVFINPTYEDNYPTTNIEAISCGTPIITYNTGGSPESAGLYGTIVDKGDIDAIVEGLSISPKIRYTIKRLDYKTTMDNYLKVYRNEFEID